MAVCKLHINYSLLLLWMSIVTGLFFLVILLIQQWSPPLRLQASHCSTFRIMCDVPSIAVFCNESIECLPGIASKFYIMVTIIIIIIIIIIVFFLHIMYRKTRRYNSTCNYVCIYLFFIPRIEFQVSNMQTQFCQSCPHRKQGWAWTAIGGTEFWVSTILTHNEFHYTLSTGSRKLKRPQQMPLETTEKDGRTLQKADRINKIAGMPMVSRWYRRSCHDNVWRVD